MTTKMKIVAIIPARGGSKSIYKKNIKLLAGSPLISYTIEAALQAKNVDTVIVSTDDSEIADISKSYGASIIERPADISGDTAKSEDALLFTLDALKNSQSYEPDITVFLQCTSPLTLPDDIDGSIECLRKHNADCVFSVTRFHHFLWSKSRNDVYSGINHDKKTRLPRQKLDPQHLETGSFYIMKTNGFIKSQHRFFGKIQAYEIPKERSIEIDDNVDFLLAETLIKQRKKETVFDLLPSIIDAVVFDFDGVFTDNKVAISEDGNEFVTCSRGDGMGIEKLKKLNIPIYVISKENSNIIKHRCEKLNIECSVGIDNKLEELKRILSSNNIDPANVIYVGNDDNDLECLRYVGCPVCVNDAVEDVKKSSKIILKSNGGQGAVRELCELVLNKPSSIT